MRKFLDDLWFGRLPLWQVFWLVYIPVIIFANVSLKVSKIDITTLTHSQLAILLPFTFFIMGYLMVALWRSAFHTETKIWGYVTRAFVIVNAIPMVCIVILNIIPVVTSLL